MLWFCNSAVLPTYLFRFVIGLSPSGELAIKDMEAYEYEYVVHEDNSNGRTLAWLSTESDTRMRPDEDINKKYYTLFQPFVDYYGTYDYVDQIITAAFDAKDTKMSKGNFNLATEESDYEAREGADISNSLH